MAVPFMKIIEAAKGRTDAGTKYASEGKGGAAANEFLNPLPAGARGAISKKLAGGGDGLPQMEDPEERAIASYAARRKRAFRTGTASASRRNALQSAMKTGSERAIKLGGGAKGLNMMTQMFNNAMLGTAQQDLAGEAQFFGIEKEQKTRLSQKKLELALLKYNTDKAQDVQDTKEKKSNQGASLMNVLGSIGGKANSYGGDATGAEGAKVGVENAE